MEKMGKTKIIKLPATLSVNQRLSINLSFVWFGSGKIVWRFNGRDKYTDCMPVRGYGSFKIWTKAFFQDETKLTIWSQGKVAVVARVTMERNEI